MKAADAVYQVLLIAGQPLSIAEITKRILEQAIWLTNSQTPQNTISATLSVDIRKYGAKSRFVHMGKSLYGLNQTLAIVHDQLPSTIGDEKLAEIVSQPKFMSFTDAAEFILQQDSEKQPTHYQTITEKALNQQLISTKGLTPAATMYAQITTEIERKKKRGEHPRFVIHGKGYVGLSAWEPQGLEGLIGDHNKEVRERLRARLQDIPAKEFEELIALLLAKMGFNDECVTPYSGDKGVDVRATLVVAESIQTRMAVQVKRWKRNVQADIVQKVRGSLSTHEQGLVITTSNFTKGAIKEAKQPDKIPVGLMNGNQLIDLIIENNIGIVRTTYDLIELDESEE